MPSPSLADGFDFGQISFESDSTNVLSLSRTDKDFKFPLTRAPINFSVLRGDGLLSNQWGVQINKKGDAYVYCRDTPNAEKVSLHASGRQHIAMPSEETAHEDVGRRYGNIWKEPEFESKAIATFSLIFPPWGIGIPRDVETLTKDELLIIGHREKMVVVGFFVVDAGRTMEVHMSHFVLGQLPMKPGKTLHVIAWKEPHDDLRDRIQNVFPQVAHTAGRRQLGEGEYTIRLQGYRRPNSAYMITVPVHYRPGDAADNSESALRERS